MFKTHNVGKLYTACLQARSSIWKHERAWRDAKNLAQG